VLARGIPAKTETGIRRGVDQDDWVTINSVVGKKKDRRT